MEFQIKINRVWLIVDNEIFKYSKLILTIDIYLKIL